MKSMTREEVFEYLPDEIKWISCRKVGDWWGHTEKPKRTLWQYESEGMFYIPINIAYSGTWEDSLMERPGQEVMWRLYNSDNALALVIFRGGNPPAGGRKSELPELAPPEVAAWFRKVMEESK